MEYDEKGKDYNGLNVSFQSTSPYRMWSVAISYPGDINTPLDIFKDFEDAGWEKFCFNLKHQERKEVFYSKKGTSVFGGWSAEEYDENLKEAREILAKHGITDVPMVKLQWRDLL